MPSKVREKRGQRAGPGAEGRQGAWRGKDIPFMLISTSLTLPGDKDVALSAGDVRSICGGVYAGIWMGARGRRKGASAGGEGGDDRNYSLPRVCPMLSSGGMAIPLAATTTTTTTKIRNDHYPNKKVLGQS